MTRSTLLRSVALTAVAGLAGFLAGHVSSSNAGGAGAATGRGRWSPAEMIAARAAESRSPNGPSGAGSAVSSDMDAGGKALAALSKLLSSEDFYGRMEDLSAWLAANPQEVAALLATGPRGLEMLRSLTISWAHADAAAVAAWLTAQGDFPGRDAMAAGLASVVAKDDPAAAVAWAASLKDPGYKFIAAEESCYSFYRVSDEEALGAFRRIGLPESAFPALLKSFAESGKYQGPSRRAAQTITSLFNAAKAAGASISTEHMDSIVSALRSGVNGSGAFAEATFKVETGDWTERELAGARKFMEWSGGTLVYRTSGGDL